jgi:hypothetical protein
MFINNLAPGDCYVTHITTQPGWLNKSIRLFLSLSSTDSQIHRKFSPVKMQRNPKKCSDQNASYSLMHKLSLMKFELANINVFKGYKMLGLVTCILDMNFVASYSELELVNC